MTASRSAQLAGLSLLVAAAAACSGTPNTFRVEAAGADVAAAELRLCGRTKPLAKISDRFMGVQTVSCEGGGEIVLSPERGAPLVCEVGYVTRNAVQHFRFVVEDGRCRSV